MKIFLIPVLISSFVLSPHSKAEGLTQIPEEFIEEMQNLEGIESSSQAEIPADLNLETSAQEVSTDSFKIIGRGLQNRKTGEVIALACVGEKINNSQEPSCKRLRHVKTVPGTNKVIFYGTTYWMNLDHEPSSDELQASAKIINKAFKTYKKNDPKRQEKRMMIFGATLACGVFCTIFGIGFLTKGAGFTALFGISMWGGAMLAAPIALLLISQKPMLGKSGMITNVIADQNGWNWSTRPRIVSAKAFQWYDRYVQSDQNAEKAL